jgi:hypothetical protein
MDPVIGARFLNALLGQVVKDPSVGGGVAGESSGGVEVERYRARFIDAESEWRSFLGRNGLPRRSVDQPQVSAQELAAVDHDIAEARATLRALADAAANSTGAVEQGLRLSAERAKATVAGLLAKRGAITAEVASAGSQQSEADSDFLVYRTRFESARALYIEAVTNAVRAQMSPTAAARLKLTIADPASSSDAVKVAPKPMQTAALAALAGLLVSVFFILAANAVTQMRQAWPPSA